MFDVGFSELLLLAIVALVVLGPEKLPHAARIAGAWVGRIRRTISTMQSEIEREVATQEVRTQLAKQFGATGADSVVQALQEERKDLETLWAETQESARNALADTPATDSAENPAQAAGMDLPALAGAPVAALLPEVAKPLDEVKVDGEQAYREWLEAQRKNRIAPPSPDTTPNDPSAS
ncbi:MAG: tatB [Moraxellaceae bacterium]|jgi:sec-independent protein translocase protein TatB|nr:tatB [Moraxellaceae bacterium]